MQNITKFFKEFLKTRTLGYYLMIAAAILALVEDIIYVSYYQSVNLLRYYSSTAFILPFIAVAACLVLSMFDVTHKLAPLALYGIELCAFVLFIDSTYMYLSSAFYGGISASAIFGLSPGFLLGVLLYVIILALSIAAVFMKGRKEPSANESVNAAAERSEGGAQ